MKKIFYILIFSIVYMVITPSCKKILTPDPEQLLLNDSAIRTVKDLETVLNGAYDGLQGGNVLAGNMTGYADLLAEDLEAYDNRLSPFGTLDIYNGQTTVQIGALRGMWADCYSTISRANYVIDAVDNNALVQSDPTFAPNKDRIKGQALFIRAIVHFELMKFWSLPYNIQNPSENTKPQSGVVLRLEPYKTFNPGAAKALRSSIEECYTQIIKDLNESSNLLQANTVSSGDRISSDAAKAILARVYFNKGDYTNASSFCNQLISSNRYSLADSLLLFYKLTGTTNIVDLNGGIKPEPIFQLVNTQNDNSNALIGLYASNAGALLYLKNDTYNLYNSNDKRSGLISTIFKTSRKYVNPAPVQGEITTSPNVCIIRFAEVHLIRAEANLLSGGSTQEALDSYNLIRRRAFKTNYVEETSTEGLLDKVRSERRLEMMCEQSDRYMNLRRLRLPLRKANENEYSKFLFKIPQEEISANPD
ncbi:MAG: RagB/SusD family nutrient uptake outer membrane protein, partial [Bacteroidia bacterium]